MVIACFHCWPTILRASQQEARSSSRAILDLHQCAKGISFCVRFRLTHSLCRIISLAVIVVAAAAAPELNKTLSEWNQNEHKRGEQI
jgi:hypothetical protein